MMKVLEVGEVFCSGQVGRFGFVQQEKVDNTWISTPASLSCVSFQIARTVGKSARADPSLRRSHVEPCYSKDGGRHEFIK